MFNSYHKGVKKKFVDVIVNMSRIMMCCDEVVNNISQDNIDEMTSLIKSFEDDYFEMKTEIKKLIKESVEDLKSDNKEKEINVIETDDGFRL